MGHLLWAKWQTPSEVLGVVTGTDGLLQRAGKFHLTLYRIPYSVQRPTVLQERQVAG